MTYRVMQAAAGPGMRPLATAAMRVRPIGEVTSTYSSANLEAPTLWSTLQQSNMDSGASSSYQPPTADAEAEKKQKMLLIAGGVGAAVIVAGIAVVVIRKKK